MLMGVLHIQNGPAVYHLRKKNLTGDLHQELGPSQPVESLISGDR
jgi:hypothetical protein